MNDSSHREYAFVLVVFTLENEENAYTFNIIEHHYQRTCQGRFFPFVLRRECEGMECDFLLLPPINFMFKAPDCLSLARESEKVGESFWENENHKNSLQHYFPSSLFCLLSLRFDSHFFHSVLFTKKKSEGGRKNSICVRKEKFGFLSELFNNLFRNRE